MNGHLVFAFYQGAVSGAGLPWLSCTRVASWGDYPPVTSALDEKRDGLGDGPNAGE